MANSRLLILSSILGLLFGVLTVLATSPIEGVRAAFQGIAWVRVFLLFGASFAFLYGITGAAKWSLILTVGVLILYVILSTGWGFS